ncbi:MAG TPA: PaaI family thioesterase [Oligoflexus sp.]|uniref:PaaI family thioesterase n=1 Tax=Oligoflexus sp. TaxID=1971216 RepID=UPI002D2E71B3|nr:PaaI family thioesterase [Oligoflexus sp.]HYX32069.1 PaaI family thioesterase [Oligoflexus sp.]
MTKHKTTLGPLGEDWQEIRLPFDNVIRSFVSGEPEGDRIRVRYYKTKEPNVLMGRIWFGPGAEGPPGHTHGGAQAAAIDEICGGAVWAHGFKVVAINLETDFSTFVPLNTELVLYGIIARHEGRKIYTEGRIEDLNGRVLARGRVLFIELNEEQLAKFSGFAGGLDLSSEILPPRQDEP